MAAIRRYLALVALMLWQGGFTFYAGVVVPTGQQVLGSHLGQGLITQQVTRRLNSLGVLAVALISLEAWAAPPSRRKRLAALCAAMALMLAALFFLHSRLDDILGASPAAGFDHALFYGWHRAYLWISTAQWLCALAYLWLVLRQGK